MAQVPALRWSDDGSIDYTPVSAVNAGDVVVIGNIPFVAPLDIAAAALGSLQCRGVFKVPKITGAFSAGDAVYWNATGNPNTGTAGTGAADSSASGNYLMGVCTKAAASSDDYVYVLLTAARRTATLAGSLGADDITGTDSVLSISGLAGSSSAGGAIPIIGGAGNGSGNAGGAVTLTGGAAGSGNAAGGATGITGGVGAGSSAGGAAAVTGGASAASSSGAGGAASLTGGAVGTSGTGTGGAVTVTGGAGRSGGTAGSVTIDAGAANSGTAGTITIGGTNAASVTFGKMPRIPTATVAAAGTNQGTATAITEGFTLVSAADDTVGVILPSAVAGMVAIVKSSVSNKILKVYPNTSDAINALSVNAAISLASGPTVAMFVAYDATTWYTLPLLPS